MKACPGLRSGIDRSGSLSFAIRGIPSPIRPPIRHSGEGRNPEGWGEGNVARSKTSRGGLSPANSGPAVNRWRNFHPLTWPRQRHGDSGESMSRTPIRVRNPGKAWSARPQQKSKDPANNAALGLVPSPWRPRQPALTAPTGVRPLSSSAGTSLSFTPFPAGRCSGVLMNLLAILPPWTGYAVARTSDYVKRSKVGKSTLARPTKIPLN